MRKEKEGVRATGSEIGTRYEIKLGCVLSLGTSPIQKGIALAKNLKLSRMTEFGMGNPLFQSLSLDIKQESEAELKEVLDNLLDESIDKLDLSDWQRKKLKENDLLTIKSVLETTEEELISKIPYVAEKRARRMKNAAMAEILEYLSG